MVGPMCESEMEQVREKEMERVEERPEERPTHNAFRCTDWSPNLMLKTQLVQRKGEADN